MKAIKYQSKHLLTRSLMAFGLATFSTGLLAQPVITYTSSGTPGNFTLDFTVNNTTPGTDGFDIYYFGVLVNGQVSGSPQGYNAQYFSNIHTVEITGPASNWPFNNFWIDPTYSALPTGENLSGFDVSDTDQNVPTSVQYFAIGYGGGLVYAGPGNENLSSPANPPLFTGYALAAVPEPATFPLLAGVSMLLLAAKHRYSR
jgi:hypothetical protein